MTVRCEDGQIILVGRCRIEDAESLLSALQLSPDSLVDMSAAETVHTAVLQILLALKPPLVGLQTTGFLAKYELLDPRKDAAVFSNSALGRSVGQSG